MIYWEWMGDAGEILKKERREAFVLRDFKTIKGSKNG